MNLEEIIHCKNEMERKINEAVREFENKTGLNVNGIDSYQEMHCWIGKDSGGGIKNLFKVVVKI